MITYEFLVGCVPFWGNTPEELFESILNESIEWPEGDRALIPDVQDFIVALLQQETSLRLGTVAVAEEVRMHPFFVGLDWQGLLRQKAEFVPILDDEEDTSYFDRMLK